MKLSDFKLCDMPDNCILPPGHAPVIDTGTYSPLLEQIFRTMFDECSRRDAGYEQLCHNLMGSALIVILRLINRAHKLLPPVACVQAGNEPVAAGLPNIVPHERSVPAAYRYAHVHV